MPHTKKDRPHSFHRTNSPSSGSRQQPGNITVNLPVSNTSAIATAIGEVISSFCNWMAELERTNQLKAILEAQREKIQARKEIMRLQLTALNRCLKEKELTRKQILECLKPIKVKLDEIHTELIASLDYENRYRAEKLSEMYYNNLQSYTILVSGLSNNKELTGEDMESIKSVMQKQEVAEIIQ